MWIPRPMACFTMLLIRLRAHLVALWAIFRVRPPAVMVVSLIFLFLAAEVTRD